FIDFLNEIRIRNAARLLAQDTNLNISEVCYIVGYKSITNFNQQFKIIMGTNPKNYRDSVTGFSTNVALLEEVG
ncbi:MAG: helix-turn-helix domain-containing protein, partial [Ginsengibacter sp.]